MTAALGTLPFIATLWLLVVLGAKVLEESGARIAAALKGEPAPQPLRCAAPTPLRTCKSNQQPIGASAQWRAAA